MELPTDYNGENMLIGANKLNNTIKQYLSNIRPNADTIEEIRDNLLEYRFELEEYILDISDYDFAPRRDNLTKRGILIDLRENVKILNKTLSELSQTGGRRHKGRNKSSRKMRARSMRARSMRAKSMRAKSMRSRRARKSLRRRRY
jgi:hypothetical protein